MVLAVNPTFGVTVCGQNSGPQADPTTHLYIDFANAYIGGKGGFFGPIEGGGWGGGVKPRTRNIDAVS